MHILGIETSCDETAVCVLECTGDFGGNFAYKTLGDALISQIAIHAPYGGVFPNLAKREHQRNLTPLLSRALDESGLLRVRTEAGPGVHSPQSVVRSILERETELLPQVETFLQTYDRPHIDCIAVTAGPGLEPALWVGVNFARALATQWELPLVAVNHMEGHIIASLVTQSRSVASSPQSVAKNQGATGHELRTSDFPAVALLASGGHTELQLVKGLGEYSLIGETRDDAAGEAFDKIARILDLPYPGGPEISRLAAEARAGGLVSPAPFPRPMLDSGDYDFSFSGLKTAARKLIEAHQPMTDDLRSAFSCEAEEAIVETLVIKTMRAADEHDAQTIIVGGGVSANVYLRSRLAEAAASEGRAVLFPGPGLSTDNAVMIALAGYFRALKEEFTDPAALRADGNMRLSSKIEKDQ